MMPQTLDLQFQNIPHAIASYLMETQDGPILIETGPYSTYPHLVESLAARHYKPPDVKHVFLTHIHLDHAGAAWAFAEAGATIYLHPFGAKNMEDPTRLMESATRIYGDDMDRLWGTMKKIPGEQLYQVADQETFQVGGMEIKAWYTPGHARHHIAWQIGSDIFTGDVAGVKIERGPVVPPCPPPDINIEDWKNSIAILRQLAPDRLFLTHYDAIDQVRDHLDALEGVLDDWANWIKVRFDAGRTPEEVTPDFMRYTAEQLRSQGLNESEISVYEAANPSWMSVAGLMRYWSKKV